MENYGELLKGFEKKAGARALAILSDYFRFDYNGGGFVAIEAREKLTARTLEKILTECTGATVNGLRVCVCFVDNVFNRFRVCEYTRGKFENVERFPYCINKLEYFYRVADLDECRKRGAGAFVFAQPFDELRPEKIKYRYGERPIKKGERVKLLIVREALTKDGEKYPYGAEIKRQNGERGADHVEFENRERNGIIFDYIDKSGYNVGAVRYELRARAYALRTKRQKEEADNTNTGAEVLEMKSTADELRAKIAEAITAETITAEALELLGGCLNGWRGTLSDAYKAIKRHEERETAKEYASNKAKADALARIAETLQAVRERYEKATAEGGRE